MITVEGLPKAPTALTADVQPVATLPAGAQVALNWIEQRQQRDERRRRARRGRRGVQRARHAGSDRRELHRPDGHAQARTATGSARCNAVGPSAYAGPVSVTVPQPASTTVVRQQPEPIHVGDTVTFTATVTRVLATATPSGTVTFTANGATTSVALDAAGVATFTTSALPAGTSTITADYSGDAVFKPSTDSLIQMVNKAATTVVVVSSLNPSTVGAAVTFTATVSPLTATGTVDFTIDGGAARQRATRRQGRRPITTSALAVGAHAVIATYGGDAAIPAATAPTLTQTVGPVTSGDHHRRDEQPRTRRPTSARP